MPLSEDLYHAVPVPYPSYTCKLCFTNIQKGYTYNGNDGTVIELGSWDGVGTSHCWSVGGKKYIHRENERTSRDVYNYLTGRHTWGKLARLSSALNSFVWTLSTLLVAARFAAINNDMMSFTLKS